MGGLPIPLWIANNQAGASGASDSLPVWAMIALGIIGAVCVYLVVKIFRG